MASRNNIPLSEVQEHGPNHADPWLIVSGKVIAVGSYKDEHPGGDEVLLEYAGKDATKAFNDAGHGSSARNDMLKYVVGQVEESETTPSNTTTTTTEPQTSDEKKECLIQ